LGAALCDLLDGASCTIGFGHCLMKCWYESLENDEIQGYFIALFERNKNI